MAVFTSFLQTFEDYDLFHLIGLICGLAIYNLTIVELNFPVALYKKLLKREATLDDLKELMPDVGRSETITCGFPSTNLINELQPGVRSAGCSDLVKCCSNVFGHSIRVTLKML